MKSVFRFLLTLAASLVLVACGQPAPGDAGGETATPSEPMATAADAPATLQAQVLGRRQGTEAPCFVEG